MSMIFVSHSHLDRKWFDRDRPFNLIPWLENALRRDGVTLWYDRSDEAGLQPGDRFEQEITQAIDRADVALLLISEAFFSSEFIRTVELPRILARGERGEITVIPVLLEPCDWQSFDFVAARQMLPGAPTPLIDYTESERQWTHARAEILSGVRRRIRGGGKPAPPTPVPLTPTPQPSRVRWVIWGVLLLLLALCTLSTVQSELLAMLLGAAKRTLIPRTVPIASVTRTGTPPVATYTLGATDTLQPPPTHTAVARQRSTSLATPVAATSPIPEPAESGLTADAIWPMFNGGLAHWSRLSFAGPAHAEFTEQSGFYEIGSYAGVAIAADGTRYDVSSRTHGEAGTALAATSADGLKWTVELSRWGGGIAPCERTPAVGSDGTIYVGSYDGTLYAISPAGSVKWMFAAGDYINSSVAAVSDGTVYLAGGYFLYAINADGSLRWKYSIGWGTGSPAVDDDGTVYISGGNRMQIHAVDSQGVLRWKYTMPKQVRASPLVADTGIYCVDEDGTIYSLARDGRLRWDLATGDPVYGSPALGLDGTIYVQSEGAVHAVSAEGSLKWTYRSSNIGSHVVCGGEGATPRVDTYGTIYVPCGYPDVCAIDPSGNFLGYYRPTNP